jgi:Mid domain of argonaute/Argonaute linker 2 domain
MNLNAFDKNKYLNEWGLKIKSEPIMVEARVLPTPQIQYHQTSKQQGLLTPQNGTWNLIGQKLCAGAELVSWSVICFSPQRSMQLASIEAFVRELCNTAVDCGVRAGFDWHYLLHFR